MSEDLFTNLKEHKNKVIIISMALVVLDFLIWFQITNATGGDLEMYFLDVGQGDSELIVLPGEVKVLIDGGPPNGRVLDELGMVFELGDRYIDIVILSHPQLDHFGGLIEVLKRYNVGAFIWNGAETAASEFPELEKVLRERNVREVILGAGDKITNRDSEIFVVSPDESLVKAKDSNDTSLVLELKAKDSTTLFTGDISAAVEGAISREDVDILKVAHHGSKFSSSADFLEAVKPEMAVIEVGRNSYGHPTFQTLEGLKRIGAQIFRTDSDGTLKFAIDGNDIKVFKDLW
ncbi:MAG: MBL fold metallo-hydrolase [Candidatus Jorgensenbacteria bacterium]